MSWKTIFIFKVISWWTASTNIKWVTILTLLWTSWTLLLVIKISNMTWCTSCLITTFITIFWTWSANSIRWQKISLRTRHTRSSIITNIAVYRTRFTFGFRKIIPIHTNCTYIRFSCIAVKAILSCTFFTSTIWQIISIITTQTI